MSRVWPVNAYFLICFSENSEKYIEVDSIICILTTYKHNQDVLELKEEELILLQDEIQQTSDVLTLTEQGRSQKKIRTDAISTVEFPA